MTTRKPLEAASDSVHLWRLGGACRAALDERAGDYIDRGLILLRLLNEAGYEVIPKPHTPPFSLRDPRP